MDALRERDPGALLEKTALPFDFRDTRTDARKKSKCGTHVAATTGRRPRASRAASP